MRHRVLFVLPKLKACAALGADGMDEGTEAPQVKGTAESSEKDGG